MGGAGSGAGPRTGKLIKWNLEEGYDRLLGGLKAAEMNMFTKSFQLVLYLFWIFIITKKKPEKV